MYPSIDLGVGERNKFLRKNLQEYKLVLNQLKFYSKDI